MTPVRSKTYTALQKAYDQCYLTCTTASYYESQGNEGEALRCWRDALGQIQYFNASSRHSGAFRSLRVKSETEKALETSLKAMELQCQERIDLLETLRLSREDAQPQPQSQSQSQPQPPPHVYPPQTTNGASAQGESSRKLQRPHPQPYPAPVMRSEPNFNQGGLSDNPLPPLPLRPNQQPPPRPDPPVPRHTSNGTTSTLIQSNHITGPPIPPVAYPRLGRVPSPEKRTGFLTTLRTKKPPRNSQTFIADGPGTAAKAAGLAWNSISRTSSDLSKTSSGGSTEQLSIREPEPSGSSRPGHSSSSDNSQQSLTMPDPSKYCPPTRPNGPAGPRPRPQSTVIRTSSMPPQNSHPQISVSRHSPTSSSQTPPVDLLPRRETTQGPVTRRSIEKLSQKSNPLPPIPPKSNRLSMEDPLGKQAEQRRDSIYGAPVSRKPIPSGSPNGTNKLQDYFNEQEAAAAASAERTSTENSGSGEEGDTEEDGEDGESEDEARIWKKRVRKALKELDKGVDESAASQIINEIVVKGDEVHWDDVAGLEAAKTALKEAVVYPFLRPDLFRGLREPARGMLLFGPPGTGKTMIARAVATESKSTFFSISASSLTSKYLGESEKLVRALFALAKALAPSIIFVDEIDSLLSSRSSGEHEATRRLKTEFLIQWSSLQNAAAGKERTTGDPSRVLVLAATNLPWAIDEAARRRFVRRQYIPLPEHETRTKQFEKLLSHQKHALTPDDLQRLVELTDGFSGSDITALAKDAAMGPLRSLGEALLSMSMEEIRPIELQDFERSLGSIRPSVSKSGLEEFEKWAKEFGERV